MTGRSGPGRAVVVYTLLRLGLFLVCLAVFYLVGVDVLLALILAALVSGIAGYFLLARQRIALSAAVDEKVTRVRDRTAARTAREDAIADQLLADQHQHQPDQPPGREPQ